MSRHPQASRLATAASLMLAAGACAAQAPRYHVVDLGNILMVSARTVQNDGTVLGAYAAQPAYWNGHEWVQIADGHQHGAITAAANRRNLIVGTLNARDGEMAGVVWEGRAKRPQRIANPSGGRDVAPTAINTSQVVVGNADQTPGGPMQRCFRWAAGASVDLGTLGSGDACTASGIDEAGTIVGNANVVPGGPSHAFTWKDGSFTDLGSFGGDGGTAAAINRLGHVVGSGALPLQSGQSLPTSHAFVWTGGALQDLGTLGGPNSTATGINASDTVVGYSDDATGGSTGFLWKDGTLYGLDALVADGDGWDFTGPAMISDSGAIIGLGFYQHFPNAFMLVPE